MVANFIFKYPLCILAEIDYPTLVQGGLQADLLLHRHNKNIFQAAIWSAPESILIEALK